MRMKGIYVEDYKGMFLSQPTCYILEEKRKIVIENEGVSIDLDVNDSSIEKHLCQASNYSSCLGKRKVDFLIQFRIFDMRQWKKLVFSLLLVHFF